MIKATNPGKWQQDLMDRLCIKRPNIPKMKLRIDEIYSFCYKVNYGNFAYKKGMLLN